MAVVTPVFLHNLLSDTPRSINQHTWIHHTSCVSIMTQTISWNTNDQKLALILLFITVHL